MRYVVTFEDHLQMPEVRRTCAADHLKFLEAHHAEIPIAGGLRDEHGGPHVGALWVFEVESRSRAIELIEQDPYYRACPRIYRLHAWGKALPDRHVLM